MPESSPAPPVRVEVGGQRLKAPSGASVAEVFRLAALPLEEVVAATLDNHLVSLRTEVNADAVLAPVHRSEPFGRDVVRRSTTHMLHAVVAEQFPGLHLVVGQSILGGHFYEVYQDGLCGEPLELPELCLRLTDALAKLAAEDRAFEVHDVSVEAAPAILSDPAGTKRNLLEAWARPRVSLVRLGGFVDLPHGASAPSTRFCRGARVIPYPPGLLLLFPGSRGPATPEDGRILWAGYREARDWLRRVGVATVGDLNRASLEDRIEAVVRVSEAQHEKKIAEIADDIAGRGGGLKLVLVAGPSSAGKTTFVKRLSVQLQVNGIHPLVVGLDDYYRERSECPRDASGDYDLEALEALDLGLLDEHLAVLLEGGEVLVPRFDFVHERRAAPSTFRPVRLGPNQALILEGIHGLNPRLTGAVPEAACYRIFINALTQLIFDEHNRIFTADARLLRRIVRDRRYRGTGAAETIRRWPSVRRGEERHIFPFEDRAHAIFNSALVYEIPVLKTFAWRYLLEVPRAHPSRVQAYRLLQLLEPFVPVFPDAVPATSVLREFVGGSGFSY